MEIIKKSELEQSIRGHNPELTKVSVGCLIYHKKGRAYTKINGICEGVFRGGATFSGRVEERDTYTVIGHDIMLHHVLLWMGQFVGSKGYGDLDGGNEKIELLDLWQLRKETLSEQSDEVIVFLHDYINVS